MKQSLGFATVGQTHAKLLHSHSFGGCGSRVELTSGY